MPKAIEITGQTFGYLTAIRRVGVARDGKVIWLFQCRCGKEHKVTARDVVSGHSKSCGCYAKERLIERNFKHGATKHDNISTPTFKSWCYMKARLYNKSYHGRKYYVDKGIKICDRWLDKQEGFKNFLHDMGERPVGMTLDRIDNDGDYSPENCRWATRKEQANNMSTNKIIEFGGRKQTQSQWAEELGHPNPNIIHKRLKRGWSLEKTLTTPLLR